MANKIVKLPSISRVVPGSKAVLEVPVKGPTYKKVLFVITAAAGLDVSDIGRIDVLFNGNVRQTYKNLQRLIDLNTYYKRSTDSVGATRIEFMLSFFSAQYDNLAYKLATGIGTADLASFNIEMEIATGAPADIAMEATAYIDTEPQPIGAFVGIREYGISSSVTGEIETDKLGKNGEVYHALHLAKADISRVTLEADQNKVIQATKQDLERYQKDASPNPRVPVSASYTHIDFLMDGNAGDVFNTRGVNDLRLKMVFDTVGAAEIVAETLETL